MLATDLAGVGGIDLPVEVSAIDSFPSVTDAPERSLSIVARMTVDLADVYMNNDDPITPRSNGANMSACTCSSGPTPGSTTTEHPPRSSAISTTDGSVMRVHELIDILSDQPADAVVELSVIAPVDGGVRRHHRRPLLRRRRDAVGR